MADEKPEEASSGTELVPVSEEELRTAFSGPAVRSNKIYLSMTESGVRLSFMEQHGDVVPPVFRMAVILSVQDALSLRDLIARQLKGLEISLKEAMMEAETEATTEDGK